MTCSCPSVTVTQKSFDMVRSCCSYVIALHSQIQLDKAGYSLGEPNIARYSPRQPAICYLLFVYISLLLVFYCLFSVTCSLFFFLCSLLLALFYLLSVTLLSITCYQLLYICCYPAVTCYLMLSNRNLLLLAKNCFLSLLLYVS